MTGSDYVFYFAGRPVANLGKAAFISGDESISIIAHLDFITTGNLGAPILVTSGTGDLLWEGGFEPFGADGNGALGADIFLRLPGQWEDPSWRESGDTSRIYYNVYRWYSNDVGRYTSPDPAGPLGGNQYIYARRNPLVYIDPLGLRAIIFSGCSVSFFDDHLRKIKECPATSGVPGSGVNDVDKPFQGAIPPGTYMLYPREFTGAGDRGFEAPDGVSGGHLCIRKKVQIQRVGEAFISMATPLAPPGLLAVLILLIATPGRETGPWRSQTTRSISSWTISTARYAIENPRFRKNLACCRSPGSA